jgi:uncharacterized membrane protein YfcA
VNPLSDLAIAGAGLAAGTINAVVGSGSLITFPTLVGLGYSPFVANVTNSVGLVPGYWSAVHGYRPELAGQRDRALVLGCSAAAGGLVGGTLLLEYPSSFEAVVPWLVLAAVAMVLIQPKLTRYVASRSKREHGGSPLPPDPTGLPGLPLRASVALSAVYGGYFGAAHGVIMIAILAVGLDDNLQRMNALKNLLGAIVNTVAAILFVLLAPVAWVPAAIIAGSSILGGQIGARVGRRLNPGLLRALIVACGLAVAIEILA